MADGNYGVYVSIRDTDGRLISSSRPEWALVREDLDAIFGVGYADTIVSSMRGEEAEIISLPVGALDAPLDEESAGMTAEDVAAALGVPTPPVPVISAVASAPTQAPSTQFESCNVCGATKDKWNPPGVSKAGKKYQGFWGCSNFRNHPR